MKPNSMPRVLYSDPKSSLHPQLMQTGHTALPAFVTILAQSAESTSSGWRRLLAPYHSLYCTDYLARYQRIQMHYAYPGTLTVTDHGSDRMRAELPSLRMGETWPILGVGLRSLRQGSSELRPLHLSLYAWKWNAVSTQQEELSYVAVFTGCRSAELGEA